MTNNRIFRVNFWSQAFFSLNINEKYFTFFQENKLFGARATIYYYGDFSVNYFAYNFSRTSIK